MLQILVVSLVVVASVLYWLHRLAPATVLPLWQGLARTLPAGPLRQRAQKLATQKKAGGCGGCSGCDKSGGCH
ncbi:hypothetical protein OQ496_03105 [Acetobacter suratthaniensis]|uniref:FeoB-associated Cys-rich membrane protein n=1 Tax=Acetobacter suratthaniensis TaxID=1502841 RepID=A0ABS3LH79_9PROT|nr:DUF6587 family protein [Acetobacter suratthaniensis]MBO1326946.1 hypothetical protein [Acetobacter suratthaniensis]MCX2565444.1 hypothetical protein [Acetobacter suratthaniensis]